MSLSTDRQFVVVTLLVMAEALFFGYYGYTKHTNYLSSIIDLGQFDQAVWGFLVGEPFLNTVLFATKANWLGGHFNPILVLFVPFYTLAPSVNWFIAAQALALPCAALPIYLLARRLFDSSNLALAWSVAYLCNPFVLNAASWDFHVVSLTVPCIALACYAVEVQKFRWLLLISLLLLVCKEHFGLMVIGFGLLWGIKHRSLIPALILMALGGVGFALVVGLLMPMFSHTGELVMMTTESGQLDRYGWLGRSFKEVLQTIVQSPLEVIETAVIKMDGWVYLLLLGLPFLFLSLVQPWMLLPGLADFVVNLLSVNSLPRSIYSYHSATLIPVILVAAMYGLRCCAPPRSKLAPRATFAMLLVSLVMGYFLSTFYPLPGHFFSWAPCAIAPVADPALADVKELVGDASISVQANLGAHFSQRRELYRFPQRVGDVEMIVLQLQSPTEHVVGENPRVVGSLGFHLQMAPRDYLARVETLLTDQQYGVIYYDSRWLVLGRGRNSTVSVDGVSEKLGDLAIKWQ